MKRDPLVDSYFPAGSTPRLPGQMPAAQGPHAGPRIWIIALALAACAPLEQRPPEIRTTTVEVKVPVPVPCFTEAERPVLAPPTPIDIDRATVDQMAAAIAADDLADQLFAKAIDALFVLCMRRIADGTATTTVGK